MIRGDYWWVYLRDSGFSWAQKVSENSLPTRKGSCVDSKELPVPDDANIVLCISGEHVNIYTVKVPPHNRRQFLDSLPYTLEDKLIHRPEDYHFVPFKNHNKSDVIPVAVIKKSILEGILTQFKRQNWKIKLMIPDYLFIEKPSPESWMLDARESPMLLRFSDYNIGTVFLEDLTNRPPGALFLAIENIKLLPKVIDIKIKDKTQHEMVKEWSDVLASTQVKLNIIEDKQLRGDSFSETVLPSSAFNLLTGSYIPVIEISKKFKRILPTIALTSAIILSLISQWFVEGYQLKSDYSELQTAIEKIYMNVFPEARNLIDPRYQMEQKLIQLKQNLVLDTKDQFDLIFNLEQIASILTVGNNQLHRLNFDGRTITLEISSADYESLELLQQQLDNIMVVKVNSTNLRDNMVFSRISLEERI